MKNISLELVMKDRNFLVYEVFGKINGQIEVQFDNNEFNGIISFCKEHTDEEFIILNEKEINKEEYTYIVKSAKNDYKEVFGIC